MWDEELKIAKQAAVAAGRKILEIYNGAEDLNVEYKDGDMPLTAADKAANAIITELLQKHFPDHAILSEEGKDDLSRLENRLCFIVDPLDGTKEFLKRNGQFTVNIALSFEHRSVMGVIYVPVTGDLYYAAQKEGSFLESKNGEKRRLQVSSITDITALRVVMSNSHGCKEMDELIGKYQLKNLKSIGSSLKGCLVAAGEAEIYYRFNPTMEWDTAAMQCIAEEAGAIFRQMDDTEMLYNREDPLNRKGFYLINQLKNRLR